MRVPDQLSFQQARDQAGPAGSDPEITLIDFDAILAMIRRQWLVMAVMTAAFAAIGFAYVSTTVPQYTAYTSLIMDRGTSGVISDMSENQSRVTVDDEASILSQLEIIKSDSVADAVVDKLNLSQNPVFTGASGFSLGKLLGPLNIAQWFRSDEDVAEDTRTMARTILQKNMAVARSGQSYVINLGYTSPSAQLSSDIANAYASTYLLDKFNARFQSTRRASEWLEQRLAELKQQVMDSDLAVQKFRRDNGLIAAKDGLLVNEQQLSELNSSLIVAQADTARAQAKYNRIQTIINERRSDALVTDALVNSISANLRDKYLTASRRHAEISQKFGENHVQAVRLRGEMQQYEEQMFDELGRIAESYQSELDVARAKQKSLEENVASLTSVSAMAGETQVQLRELERSADSYKNLYQTFLARYQEAMQQQSFPVTEARVITQATPPLKPSRPNKPMLMTLFAFFGLVVGASIGGFREFRDRFLRTGDQVRDQLGLEYLGLAPLITGAGRPANASEPARPGVIRPLDNAYCYCVDHPLSQFSETLRSAKMAADLSFSGEGARVIGVVSALPGEGKTTISANLSGLLSMQGARTLLIDADLRNPGATRALALHADRGILEALTENEPLDRILMFDPQTHLAFLPAVVRRRVPHSSDLLASPAMARIMETLRRNFDYIIVDLPPLGAVVDARAVAPMLDSLVMVVKWGETSPAVVRNTLFADAELHAKCVGVVLNKVDMEKMKLYGQHGSNEYYHSHFASYYHEK
ncbi:polysaccharide biosynthesis tyrosine autokinase [Neorhizobium sp. NPDC001467]|uniref:polysaccharide biosynthesis tyrosine autokinase n=1 Tax=Neorhizobium sp. NPDC001467 TaxID=3390595 RepID=UPI003D00B33D